MSSTPERVRFTFAGRELAGEVIGSDWEPTYNAHDDVRLSIDVGGTTVAVDSSQVLEIA